MSRARPNWRDPHEPRTADLDGDVECRPEQAFRLVPRGTYGCGSVPDFDRLPPLRMG